MDATPLLRRVLLPFRHFSSPMPATVERGQLEEWSCGLYCAENPLWEGHEHRCGRHRDMDEFTVRHRRNLPSSGGRCCPHECSWCPRRPRVEAEDPDFSPVNAMASAADSSAGSSTHGNGGPGGDLKWHTRPGSQFWGFRGAEDPDIGTTVICAKRSLVKGMRLMLFQLRHDGTYVKKTKSERKKPSWKDKNCTQ